MKHKHWIDEAMRDAIAAAMEPITQVMAAALLGWDAAQQERVLEATGLLFPVRDGKFHVFHKTAVDWLTGEIAADSSLKSSSAVFRVERRDGHARLATGKIVSESIGGMGRVGTSSVSHHGETTKIISRRWLGERRRRHL